MRTREESVRHVEGQLFDVCVIGGGATGSGCALDAQLRGFKAVQFDAGDFASATSSASTKMAHGGVRYLEQAVREFDLAEYKVLKRSLRERIHMLKNAPFLARAESFLTPCFSWLDAAYFTAGLKLYDWLAGDAGLGSSHFLSREETLRRMPALESEHVAGAVSYVDGQFDDARYNIALVRTFVEAGGEALNYARVVAFEKDARGKIVAAEVEDAISRRRFMVRARAFINATGPYADTVREMAAPGVSPRMRFSKGAHIFLPLEVLPGKDALLIPKTDDGRVLFAIPWMGRLLVGTTEQEITLEEELCVTRSDVEYLLRHLNRYLARPVTPDQVVSGVVGVRPLVSSGETKDTKKLARDHVVEVDERSGLVSIMGGKWTTYRAMAEDTIDAAQKYLGVPVTPSSTRNHPLLGSDGYTPDFWKELVKQYGVSEPVARHLAGKYGARATDVLKLAKKEPRLAAPLLEGLAPIQAEVVFGVRHEMAVSIEDILARRIGLQFYGWREAIQAAPIVAELMAQELGWPETVKQESLDQYICKIEGWMRKAGLTLDKT